MLLCFNNETQQKNEMIMDKKTIKKQHLIIRHQKISPSLLTVPPSAAAVAGTSKNPKNSKKNWKKTKSWI